MENPDRPGLVEKGRQTIHIGLHVWRKLKKKHAQATGFVNWRNRVSEPLQSFTAVLQAEDMGDALRRLEGKSKVASG